MIQNLKLILKEITDLERSLRRKEDPASLKKLQLIKKLVKSALVEEMQK